MTHSFPFEQFQCDTRLRRRETRRDETRRTEPRRAAHHGCLAVMGKKADETPGTKEMRQGLWGARAVTCIVCRRHVSLPSSFHVRHPHRRRRRHRHRSFSAILVSFSPPASARTTVLLQRLVLARRFDALSTGERGEKNGQGGGGGGGYNSRRRRRCAPRHAAARLITLGRASAIEMFN